MLMQVATQCIAVLCTTICAHAETFEITVNNKRVRQDPLQTCAIDVGAASPALEITQANTNCGKSSTQ